MLDYSLSKPKVGTLNVSRVGNIYTFMFPCGDSMYECTPYTVTLKPGYYQIEAWGSVGRYQILEIGPAIPGLGGYTSGVLKVNNTMKIYLFVGSTSYFNCLKQKDSKTFFFGGGSSDVRLYVNESFEWSDPLSLRSRIMVSGGGGGSEWTGSIGGNAGGLVGGIGKTKCLVNTVYCDPDETGGGTQTSGGFALPSMKSTSGIPGLFGKSPINYAFTDMGGVGGNGYYSGASTNYTGAGGGGSSFISGYEGCIALNSSEDETPSPSNSSIHYSGVFFSSPIMIEGNKTMPLYFSPSSRGIGNSNRGAIRITVLSYKICTNEIGPLYFLSSHLFQYLYVFISE